MTSVEADAQTRKLCLVLGGGGARGLAHLGVLRVLQRENIVIHSLVGTSAGSIAAAMYSMEPDAEKMIERALEYLESSEFKKLGLGSFHQSNGQKLSFFEQIYLGLKKRWALKYLFTREAIFRNDLLDRIVGALVPDGLIEESKVPFAITALDLIHGEEVVIENGDLHSALVASSSIPGYFHPVPREDRLLVDAGIINSVPVKVARRLGGDFILAVNLNPELQPMDTFGSGIEIIFRAEEIGTRHISEINQAEADFSIHPNVSQTYWLDFSGVPQLIAEGEKAAEAALPEIRAALRAPSPHRSPGFLDRLSWDETA
ncbi:MAG: patatin-like phospholipase family protein [Planctomycetota bacterium]